MQWKRASILKVTLIPRGQPQCKVGWMWGYKNVQLLCLNLRQIWRPPAPDSLYNWLWQRPVWQLLKSNFVCLIRLWSLSYRCCCWEYFPINFLYANLCHRVCFLGSLTQDKWTLEIPRSFLIMLDPDLRNSGLIGVGQSVTILNTLQIILMCS